MQTPLSYEHWRSRAQSHASRMASLADAFVKRRELGHTHAVYDFLFTYYNCSPQKLKQWVPSVGETLLTVPEIDTEYPWLKTDWFHSTNGVLSLNRERIQETTLKLATFIATLCDNITKRPPRLGCFGLHEWAMVYQLPADEVRHRKQRLRLSPCDLADFVESQSLCCTHYDAVRFFTKEARPLNLFDPQLETRLQMEQGGCLHANMDLYKWATKLWPWIGSDYIAKTFLLAVQGRELDMRASPYDLAAEGFSPIRIETEAGRKEYQQEQQLYAERATPLRQELQAFCQRLQAIV